MGAFSFWRRAVADHDQARIGLAVTFLALTACADPPGTAGREDAAGEDVLLADACYQPKYGVFGVVLDWLVLRWMMRRLGRTVLTGLAAHAERTPAPARLAPAS